MTINKKKSEFYGFIILYKIINVIMIDINWKFTRLTAQHVLIINFQLKITLLNLLLEFVVLLLIVNENMVYMQAYE
jgi:hypothetical protein